jgi:hypothetical protein
MWFTDSEGKQLPHGATALACAEEMRMTKCRELVWKEDRQQWACSDCAWVFEPYALFGDQSLNKYFDVVRRDDEFAEHLCGNFQADGKH